LLALLAFQFADDFAERSDAIVWQDERDIDGFDGLDGLAVGPGGAGVAAVGGRPGVSKVGRRLTGGRPVVGVDGGLVHAPFKRFTVVRDPPGRSAVGEKPLERLCLLLGNALGEGRVNHV
jgi:hypothetical protein